MILSLKNNLLQTTEEKRVFFLIGQSNMDGRGNLSELSAPLNEVIPRSKVYVSSNWIDLYKGNASSMNQVGPILNLAYNLSLLYPTGINYFIIQAVGGTSLNSDWAPTKSQRTAATVKYLEAMATLKNPKCKAIFWMQGESDCDTETKANLYESEEINLIAYMKSLTSCNNFISGNIGSISGYPYLSTVQAAKQNNKINGYTTGLVSTSSFPLQGDNLHFTTAGANYLGQAFYNIYHDIIQS